MTRRIIIPLADYGFDPSETAIPWQILTQKGHEVIFATPLGKPARADARMISGEGLDPWGFIPLLKKLRVVGLILRANSDARNAHDAMLRDPNFQNPIPFADLKVEDYDGMVLPGGHDKALRPYYEDTTLLKFVGDFFGSKKADGTHRAVAAVCHGVLLLARAESAQTGKSALYGRKTTGLTQTKELKAQALTRITRFWDPLYYRTYFEAKGDPKAYWTVESEVKRALQNASDFLDVPKDHPEYKRKTNDFARDSLTDHSPAWVVEDDFYVSARWPGDIHAFTEAFARKL